MASNTLASTALILATFNIIFFTFVTSAYVPSPSPQPNGGEPASSPILLAPLPVLPTPLVPSPTPSVEPPFSSPSQPAEAPFVLTPSSTPSVDSCSVDTLKLGVCGNLLNGLIGIIIGTPANSPCCTLVGGLADLDAAVCLCTAIKANVLGINLNVPVSLSLLLNYCGKEAPQGSSAHKLDKDIYVYFEFIYV